MTKTDTNTDIADIKANLKYISRDIGEIKDVLKEINKTIDIHSNEITALKGKTNAIATISLIFTGIASTLAGWLGVNR